MRRPMYGVVMAMVLVAGGCSGPAATRPAGVDVHAPLNLTETCTAQLQDLSGYLLEYAMLHRQLPEKLEDLRPLVDVDRELPLNCPASGKPYVYLPEPRSAAGTPRKLVVYDPLPLHGGKRGVILMTEAEGKQPLAFYTEMMGAEVLQGFGVRP